MTQVPLSKVLVGEEEERLVLEVLRSGMLAQGPKVAALEEAFCRAQGVAHTVAVSNGTVALVAALRVLGIGPGDEVITTPFSFNATLNAILEVGATARFADIGPDFNVDPDAVAALVGPRTAALLPVHLYGLPADMAALSALATRHGLALVEDSAQAHGATVAERGVGSFGVGTFSLYGTKNVTSGEGGLVTTEDAEVASQLKLLRNQGMRARYDYAVPGYNWRLTDVQAAIALPQIQKLDKSNERRRANATRLTEGLAGLSGLVTPSVPAGRTHVWHQYTVRVTPEAPLDRDGLAAALARGEVGCGVYYPRLMHDYPCYEGNSQVVVGDAPTARSVTEQALSLPVHPGLSENDLDRVVDVVRSAFNA